MGCNCLWIVFINSFIYEPRDSAIHRPVDPDSLGNNSDSLEEVFCTGEIDSHGSITDYTDMESSLLHSDLTYKIRGAIFAVYNNLGFGHKEVVYQRALAKELSKLGLEYKREPKLKIKYEDDVIGNYIPDFLVEDVVVVELKSAYMFPVNLDRQIINYLKATGFELALAVNFGQSRLEIKRKIWTPSVKSAIDP